MPAGRWSMCQFNRIGEQQPNGFEMKLVKCFDAWRLGIKLGAHLARLLYTELLCSLGMLEKKGIFVEDYTEPENLLPSCFAGLPTPGGDR